MRVAATTAAEGESSLASLRQEMRAREQQGQSPAPKTARDYFAASDLQPRASLRASIAALSAGAGTRSSLQSSLESATTIPEVVVPSPAASPGRGQEGRAAASRSSLDEVLAALSEYRQQEAPAAPALPSSPSIGSAISERKGEAPRPHPTPAASASSSSIDLSRELRPRQAPPRPTQLPASPKEPRSSGGRAISPRKPPQSPTRVKMSPPRAAPSPHRQAGASEPPAIDPMAAQVSESPGRSRDALAVDPRSASPTGLEAARRSRARAQQSLRESLDLLAARSSVTADAMRGLLSYLDEAEQAATQAVEASVGPAELPPSRGSGSQPASHLASPTKRLALAPAGTHSPSRLSRQAWPSSSSQELPRPLAGAASLCGSREAGPVQPLPGPEPTQLAAAVYEGVRSKIQRLEEEIRSQGEAIQVLTGQLDQAHDKERAMAREFGAQRDQALAAQKASFEAAAQRQLAFIDRLMREKEELGRRCGDLGEEIRSLTGAYEARMEDMKTRFEADLRRHKEAWQAAERSKREAWMADKTREIKEMTIRGLEPDIQRLVAKHRQDLERREQEWQLETRKRLDELRLQHEDELRLLRDRWGRERDEVLERERAAAQTKLRDQADRFDGQVAALRVRLAEEAEARVEAVERQRREDRARLEDELVAARREQEQAVAAARATGEQERAEWQRRLEREVQKTREQYEAEREGWRAALADKLRRELQDRERELRRQLEQERDEEIDAVMSRLEAESGRVAAELEAQHRAREEVQGQRQAEELRRLQEGEARANERLRQAVEREALARERCERAEASAAQLRRDLEAKTQTTSWMEEQVRAAQAEADRRERDIRRLFEEKGEVSRRAATQAVAEAAEARKRADKVRPWKRLRGGDRPDGHRWLQAARDLDALKSRHEEELQHVEARVKAAIAKKDETIRQLREQVMQLERSLRDTQMVLERQRELLD